MNRQKSVKTPQKTTQKSEKKGNAFANFIVLVCVGVSFGITAAVLYEYHRLGTVIPSGVLTALLGFWGGELLIIALRQIFGSDAVVKANRARYGSNYVMYGRNDDIDTGADRI